MHIRRGSVRGCVARRSGVAVVLVATASKQKSRGGCESVGVVKSLRLARCRLATALAWGGRLVEKARAHTRHGKTHNASVIGVLSKVRKGQQASPCEACTKG